ncbi:hypothetical protein HYALB_00007766 [Hymenoscyphus albidus]|uniref:Transcription factor domain-containing protein n=1 Tax=Hymenoscyphus albidus TaxID=595503 RepID=A0A9N9LLL7_9HELO|nr:hypothetical protein HYALB_00007766 [Hymenoscyphus albidus]
MHADASIRASPKLPNELSSDPLIEQILGGLELCLLWDKLGKRDNRLAEWWCPLDLEEKSDSEEPRVTIKDVNIALDNWKARFAHSFSTDTGTNANNLNLIYHYHYTRSCLHTHFIRRTSSNSPTDREQAEAIIKCVDSVLSIFNLYHTLGPTRRDQLRYFPGFLFVILSFCASFLMKAIQVFPALFPYPNSDLALLGRLAELMIGLGDSGHDAFISGTLILRHLDKMEMPTNQHVESFNGLQPQEGLVISTDERVS